jgi:hypothetical protein
MNHQNPRSPRQPSSNAARLVAWAEAEIAEQNAVLRDALDGSPEREALFAANTKFSLGTRRVNTPSNSLGRRA